MSALSNAERIRLARLHEQVQAWPYDPTAAGRSLADVLRRAMPDIDDVTLGRVALEFGQYVGQLADPRNSDMNALVDVTMCAALDLTATEWQEVHDAS
jgi:hypothetical protein